MHLPAVLYVGASAAISTARRLLASPSCLRQEGMNLSVANRTSPLVPRHSSALLAARVYKLRSIPNTSRLLSVRLGRHLPCAVRKTGYGNPACNHKHSKITVCSVHCGRFDYGLTLSRNGATISGPDGNEDLGRHKSPEIHSGLPFDNRRRPFTGSRFLSANARPTRKASLIAYRTRRCIYTTYTRADVQSSIAPQQEERQCQIQVEAETSSPRAFRNRVDLLLAPSMLLE